MESLVVTKDNIELVKALLEATINYAIVQHSLSNDEAIIHTLYIINSISERLNCHIDVVAETDKSGALYIDDTFILDNCIIYRAGTEPFDVLAAISDGY